MLRLPLRDKNLTESWKEHDGFFYFCAVQIIELESSLWNVVHVVVPSGRMCSVSFELSKLRFQ